jgi:hypothetical protein
MKIYVATMEALRKKKDKVKLRKSSKLMVFLVSFPLEC